MSLFRPTRWKILLCVILFLIWFIVVAQFTSFFGCTLDKLTYPKLPGQTAAESTQTQAIIEFIILIIGYPFSVCLSLDFDQTYSMFATGLSFIIDFIFIYCISCLIIFLIKKLERNKKNGK